MSILILLNIGLIIYLVKYLYKLKARIIKSDQRVMAEIHRLRNDLLLQEDMVGIRMYNELKPKSQRDYEQIKLMDALIDIKENF